MFDLKYHLSGSKKYCKKWYFKNLVQTVIQSDNCKKMVILKITYVHWRRTGLNSMGASISTTSGRGRKRGTL